MPWISPGCRNGSGRRSRAQTRQKTAVQAPIPSAMERRMAAVTPGVRRAERKAERRSCLSVSMRRWGRRSTPGRCALQALPAYGAEGGKVFRERLEVGDLDLAQLGIPLAAVEDEDVADQSHRLRAELRGDLLRHPLLLLF